MRTKQHQMELENKMANSSLGDMRSMLTYGEYYELAQMLVIQRNQLQQALDNRNETEGKAHSLFTEPLDGQNFAHTPEQCDPLGFVTVLRAAIKTLMEGKKLANPFIYMPKREVTCPECHGLGVVSARSKSNRPK